MFQSTHPRGVRLCAYVNVPLTQSFNPRTHVGCDAHEVTLTNDNNVSIHAPTWGATPKLMVICLAMQFQSTHPRGVRRVLMLLKSNQGSFNPRTHVGCDPVNRYVCSDLDGFNPRTHVGCDADKHTARRLYIVSIHAPTWGATSIRQARKLKDDVSIHAPTWGATTDWSIQQLANISFNPRTHVGCDPNA